MKHITTRPFHIMADCGKVYQFLTGIYERNWKNGVPAPFLNTPMHHLLAGWTYPIPTRTVFGNVTERWWHFVFTNIL